MQASRSTEHAYPGACHCGNIVCVFHTQKAPEAWPVRACTCSYCSRHGARYTSDPAGSFAWHAKDEARVGRYGFASGTAEFLFCSTCGVLICALSPSETGGQRAVININALENAPDMDPTFVSFDGESLEVRLRRRESGWTPVTPFSVPRASA